MIDLIGGTPLFVFLSVRIPAGVIPSFVLHRVGPDEFEQFLLHLKRNNYRTLSIGEFYDHVTGRISSTSRKVLITFDDGLRNNWSVVYPLLRKYHARAVFYVSPGLLHELDAPGPGIADRSVGAADLERFEAAHPYISWREAEEMQRSGLVDIESHSLRHRMCFVSSRIVDFQHPIRDGQSRYWWLSDTVGKGPDEYLFGAPVYEHRPRLAALSYHDDESLRTVCIEYVRERGGAAFFSSRGWHAGLRTVVRNYRRAHRLRDGYESNLQQELAIKNHLEPAQIMISERLGKQCEHFAYPWNSGGRLSLLWLKELGFKTVFQAYNTPFFPRTGSDPYSLNRTDGYWISSLPGFARRTLPRRLGRTARRMLSTPSRRTVYNKET